MDSNTPEHKYNHRSFGYCIISWNIRNYFLAACQPGTEIKSWWFRVFSTKITRWQLAFRVNREKRESCQALLRRLKEDEVNEPLKVSWKITMFDGYGDIAFMKDNLFCFNHFDEHVVDVPDPSQIQKVLDGDKQALRMEIQMIVFMNTSIVFPSPDDSDLLSLVQSMKRAVKSQKHTDVTIQLNNETLSLNKAMFATHIKVLETLENNEGQYFIDKDDNSAIIKLIEYIYSSDLSCIFEEPSISIYKHIVGLNITELLDAYSLKRETLETTIEAKKIELQWSVQDFMNNDKIQCHVTHIIGGIHCTWQLRIYPRGVPGDAETHMKYVYIDASVLDSIEPHNVVVFLKAENDDDKTTLVKCYYKTITRDMKFEGKFISIEGAWLAKPGVGTVSLAVYIATGKRKMVSTFQNLVLSNLTNFDTFGRLQNHLKHLYCTGIYSDVTLVVDGNEFKCHKFLLAARSETFCRILGEMKNVQSLMFGNIKKDVFHEFLLYLYTGNISHQNVDFLMYLCDVAFHFALQPLHKLCLTRLGELVVFNNACCVLLFAHKRRLTDLKSQAKKFYTDGSHTEMHRECHRRLETENPKLFRKIERVYSYRIKNDIPGVTDVPRVLRFEDIFNRFQNIHLSGSDRN